MLQFGLTRNKDCVILRPKIDKQNKGPPSNMQPSLNYTVIYTVIAQISAQLQISTPLWISAPPKA